MNSEEDLMMDRTCTLMVTHQCNLNCVYCYESFKSDKNMTIQMAKNIVEMEFSKVENNKRFSGIVFDFIGGEPLIRFDMIVELAEWIWSTQRSVDYILYATTNGTLLDEAKKNWFRKHKDKFCLGLSLDGPYETQEKNRKGSFSKIDIDFFQQNWPEQYVKMTISRESLLTLAKDVIYLQNLGLELMFYPAVGIDWTEKDADEYEKQLRLLSEYYLDNVGTYKPTSSFTLDFKMLLEKNEIIPKFCGTGTYMVTYDVDGTAYPCHMFTPIVLGENRSDDLKKYDFDIEEILIDPDCKDCLLINICPTCYGFNYKFRNDIALRDTSTCRMFKRQVLVAHEFQVKQLIKSDIDNSLEKITQAKALVCASDLLQKL